MSEPVEPDDLRIGTRERDAAITLLSNHFVAGRLEFDEYQQRMDAALHARTRGALRRLFRDLPPTDQPFPAQASATSDGSGRLPEPLRTELAGEGLLILDEALHGSITYRRYHAPGEHVGSARVPVVGTVAVTVRRLLVWAANAKRVDVPFAHPLRAAITLSIDKPDQLLIKVDAGAVHPDRSGLIEFRFRTPNAAAICDLSAPS